MDAWTSSRNARIAYNHGMLRVRFYCFISPPIKLINNMLVYDVRTAIAHYSHGMCVLRHINHCRLLPHATVFISLLYVLLICNNTDNMDTSKKNPKKQ